MNNDSCVLCQLRDTGKQYSAITSQSVSNVNCKICGSYQITIEAIEDIYSNKYPVYLLQGYVRYKTDRGFNKIKINTETLSNILSDPTNPSNIPEKLDILLLNLSRKTAYGGQNINISYDNDYPLGYAQNGIEFIYLIDELNKLSFLYYTRSGNDFEIKILTKGWQKCIELEKTNKDSRQCFVAMSFQKKTNSIYKNAIKKAIEETGYTAYRIDKDEHTELIPYKMLSEIRKSKFVVADFTDHKGGVYFEAGFAMGLGFRVIWVCPKVEFEKAHFDIKQYNHIIYSNEEDLYNKLKTRIEAIIL